jgi:hypothetical protein
MRYRFTLLFLLSFLLLSGCAIGEKKVKKEQPEILLAQDCGLDRFPCCASNPVCNFGQQCCVDPNNANRNQCADSCSCGKEEDFCCEGNKCADGLDCRDGICVRCGGEGELCCPKESACLAGLSCLNDHCVTCGLIGNPCCLGSEPCLTKKGENNECFSNICRSCGFDGAPACVGDKPCLSGQLFTSGRCERCGQINQPCCATSTESIYACDKKNELVCTLGFCEKKGE